MEGDIVVAHRVGVRVYDLGYCLGRCGYDKPEKCPDSEVCARYQVYVYRFNWGGGGEWRQRWSSATREFAIQEATKAALSEQGFADRDPTLREYIERANADGRI